MNIAWIGTGVMGKSMVTHLHNNGHHCSVYNRTKTKAESLGKLGMQVCDSIEECVKEAEVVFTMVGYPKDVEEVYEQIFKYARANTLLIDMTTSSPLLAEKLAENQNFRILDAPVSGGDIGALNATLSIMVGGKKADFETALPLFECMGKNIIHIGRNGCGQHAKAANQIAVAGAIGATCEAIHYAKSQNIDPTIILDAISKGAAQSWQMDHNAPKVISHDYAPGFFIKHFVKDMHIVQEVMSHDQQHLKMLDAICSMYESLVEQGMENEGTQALIEYYNK